MKKLIKTFDIKIDKIIPVFHQWIQQDIIPDHLVIDVVDYKHIIDGPGIMLIAHEANISIDRENNEIGLMYIRKKPLNKTLIENITEIKSILDFLADSLKNDPLLLDKIEFKESYKIYSNDRLQLSKNKTSIEYLLTNAKKVFKNSNINFLNSKLNSRLTIKIKKTK